MTTTENLSASITTFYELMDGTDKAPAVDLFTTDATVTDNGRTYRGRDELLEWLRGEASAYTYTSTWVAADETEGVAVIDILLEGDFPGGRVQLRYTFDLAPDGLIRDLTIAA
jgi:hypothetical protein